MRKVWRVAWTEYQNSVRSKAFIIGVLALPLMIGVSIGLQVIAKRQTDVSDRRFVVLDRTGVLYKRIEARAKERNSIFKQSGTNSAPRPDFIPEKFAETDGVKAEMILSERVRKKEVSAFLIIGKDALMPQNGPDASLAYHTQAQTFNELPDWLSQVVNEEVHRMRYERAGIDPALLQKLGQPVPVRRLGLAKMDTSGNVVEAREESRLTAMLVPMGSMFLLYMLIMSAAPALLNTVLEEKMQKISEVLIASVAPFELMLGKLLGCVMVSMTLGLLYLGSSIYMLSRHGMLDKVPAEFFAWFILFQILGLLMYGSVFSAIGAACSELKDAQNLMMPVMIMIMIPFFVWLPIAESPQSPFARWISLFPPATPMLMMMRIAIAPGPPAWEIALGLALTLAFTLGCVWAGGKIFRIGILSQGQSPTIGRLARWVFSK